MSKIPYVIRRGDTLYFRIRVPAKLQATIQKKEIIQTLQTQDRFKAIPIALRFASEVKIIFNSMSKDMTDIRHKRHIEALRERLKVKEVIHAEEVEQAKVESSREIKRVERETALKVENATLKMILLNGGQSVTPQVEEVKDKLKTPKLSFVIDLYKKECGLGEATLKKYENTFSVLLELMGDIPVSRIDNFDMLQFFVDVCNLPNRMPNREQREKRGLKLRGLISDNDGDCIHLKTFRGQKR